MSSSRTERTELMTSCSWNRIVPVLMSILTLAGPASATDNSDISQEDASRYTATLISLHLHNVSPKDAFNALAAKAAVSFEPASDVLWPNGSGERLTIDVDDQPFWSVLLQMDGRAKVRFERTNPKSPIQLARTIPTDLPNRCFAAGPFIILVKYVSQTREVEFSGPQSQNAGSGCRLAVFVWGEPKLGPFTWRTESLDKLETDDDKPFDLRLFPGSGSTQRFHEGSIGFRTSIPGTRIKRLLMTWQFAVEGKTERFEVNDVLHAPRTENLIGGYRIIFKQVKKVAERRYQYDVEAGLGNHTREEFRAFCGTLASHPPQLIDAQGHELRPDGGTGAIGALNYTLQHNVAQNDDAQQVGEPVKFVWELPSETKIIKLPVEFMDLPLP